MISPMRQGHSILIALCVGVGVFFGGARASAETATVEDLPGKEIAQHISLLTGVALSPLMGVSGVGMPTHGSLFLRFCW